MRKYLVNLTQHALTQEQKDSVDTVIEPRGMDIFLNFDEMPTADVIDGRAYQMFDCVIAMLESTGIYTGDCTVLLGGAPFFMSACEKVALSYGFQYCYAFSKRISQETIQADGTVKKISKFKHEGWIGPFED